MSSNLLLDFVNPSMMNKEADDISIDQDGEWDISLFDDLDGLGDADELLQALVESVSYDIPASDLNFDIGDPAWNSNGWRENGSPPSVDSLSPNHTLSSVSSPASVEPCSPYSSTLDEVHSPLSWNSQPSPLSVCSDSSGYSEIPVEKKPPKRTNQTLKAKLLQPAKRPIQTNPKVSIQPKPLITALPITHAAASLQAKTIIIQPLQTTVLQKPSPVTIQPAPPAGRPMLLTQPTQVVQLQTQAVTTRVVTVPMLSQDRPAAVVAPVTSSPVVTMTLSNSTPEDDSSACRRQQRMIKNRESAAISRKKKKEYLLTLEARLKLALSENEKLKNENGTLKRQLEGLMSENSVLNTTAPKRRAVCLMVVLVFLVVNLGPISLLGGNQGSTFPIAPSSSGRHLLGFSPESERTVASNTPETDPSNVVNRLEDVGSEQKALMVVKREPLYFRDPPSCQPPVNRTKCMKIANELRGWVHRHEVERTKTRRMSNTHLRGRTIPKPVDKPVSQIVTEIQYRDSSEKNPSSELQVYYAPHRTYNDFFDELNRRGDTFYVISFRRDHLLLPATSHNKGSRPKMSLVLPAMNYNESVIKDKEFEVMMQIDCEVMDTRILHIKSSSIPPILRVNQTDTDSIYHPTPSNSQPTTPVGVLMGSS
ncbi:cyclic AMP-dependent transcription factor ATF-6 alpha [Triplophysa rosa]|uniref:Cyclic AMP-dependent transcription factor ATF-6 alpha n=1 Tax=Triplophysa rosa TaxID=992332 RepID=A0A9W7WH63_TRIRA|nr:cyclic AMP-dependent transcription factor ATF-6 alpha [Triplophysa rosa]KAI7799441.1 cyclic AMP-dependent transcription factor ATF-6 alpha [Triplophysa rosa]